MVIRFANAHGLSILADEVYQENVYLQGDRFDSFAKVMVESGETDVSLFSFHSCSKGFLGECGHRGGYMEFRNIPDDVVAQIVKLQSVSLCANLTGQVATYCMVSPPQPGEPSYERYAQERDGILGRAESARDPAGRRAQPHPGHPVQRRRGRHVRVSAHRAAGRADRRASTAWTCWSRPASAWSPGTGFGQIPGTAHFRTTILPPTAADPSRGGTPRRVPRRLQVDRRRGLRDGQPSRRPATLGRSPIMRAMSDGRGFGLSAAAACAGLCLLSALPARAETMAPVADAKAMVVSGQARFTVLAPRLIRMEWSGASEFEDRASLVFINRRQPVPPFTSVVKGGWLTITTDMLTLRYKTGSGAFTASNLEVRFTLNGAPVVWHPGLEDTGNLLGTTRTLDGVNGPATKLEPGLISRDGWVVVDDSTRLLYDGSDWPWVTPRPPLDTARGGREPVEGPVGKRQDLYFFGYGHDYRGALADFTKVAGRIPMPPRFAFGIWWSRYWAYTDEEFEQLVREFEARTLPLDVLVVDMDWHLTFGGAWDNNPKDQSGHTKGWTGFTWDKNYFPDPAGFLDWTDAHGLRTPLNLHPASGIQPWESQYPAMAKAMGIDPASQKFVPFDIVDKKFATSFFDLVIHPLEQQGVDFWWLDWQQSDKTSLEGINPTWWLNYAFFTDMERQGKRRPLIFHRWGGLGNHRYEIGFSGDTYSTWQSLAYQPYFTATAANVGFGYWSHDIGGHMNGPVEPELYTRWIQFGVFSPILRTHTTKNPGAERRIWAYPPEFSDAMREAFLLRSSLIPYIYTASRGTYRHRRAVPATAVLGLAGSDRSVREQRRLPLRRQPAGCAHRRAEGQRDRPRHPIGVAAGGLVGGVVVGPRGRRTDHDHA